MKEKRQMFTVKYDDKGKEKIEVPAIEINDFTKKEKRLFTVLGKDGKPIFAKTFKG